jgi:hypothetical protein
LAEEIDNLFPCELTLHFEQPKKNVSDHGYAGFFDSEARSMTSLSGAGGEDLVGLGLRYFICSPFQFAQDGMSRRLLK